MKKHILIKFLRKYKSTAQVSGLNAVMKLKLKYLEEWINVIDIIKAVMTSSDKN